MPVMSNASFRILTTEKLFIELSIDTEKKVTLGVCIHHGLMVPPRHGSERAL